MSIESRPPPPQFVAKLRRALGGQAGWSGFAFQLLFVAALIWLGYEIVANARANLQSQRIASGFGFLNNTAGFDVSQALIPYSGSDTYARVFLVGVANTLLVTVIGIFFATVIGFIVALGRLSPNWLLSRVSGAYVEVIRNLPVLFQILFWYLAVLGTLPNPLQSVSLFDGFFLTIAGCSCRGRSAIPASSLLRSRSWSRSSQHCCCAAMRDGSCSCTDGRSGSGPMCSAH